jgi:hypothetical protein
MARYIENHMIPARLQEPAIIRTANFCERMSPVSSGSLAKPVNTRLIGLIAGSSVWCLIDNLLPLSKFLTICGQRLPRYLLNALQNDVSDLYPASVATLLAFLIDSSNRAKASSRHHPVKYLFAVIPTVSTDLYTRTDLEAATLIER